MLQLLDSLLNLFIAVWEVVYSLAVVVLPWTPLIAWVAYWLFAVNWVRFRETLIRGGWIGVLLIFLMMVLIWGLIAPPADGVHHLFGLRLSNYVGKTVYVTGLFSIMFLCGSVQLSGCCGSLCRFDESSDAAEDARGHDHAPAH